MERQVPEEIMVSKEFGENLDKIVERVRQNPDLGFLNDLIAKFPDAGVCLVGGAVRDAMLGKELKDFDFIVRGVSKEKLEKFLSTKGTVKDVESRAFGVFKFYPSHIKEEDRGSFEPVEIALPRTEKQTGEGYKDFQIESDPDLPLESDLARRDFTINAIALDLKSGVLIDPYGGLKDLKDKKIKAVGDPVDRFDEDPSRMLRALRFAAQLGFEIDKKTWSAIKKKIPEINETYKDKKGRSVERVAREVIAKEFLKGFDADPIGTIDLYEESGALEELFPEFIQMKKCDQPKNFHSEGDVLAHAKLAVQNLYRLSDAVKEQSGLELDFVEPTLELKFAVFIHDIGKPPAKMWKEEYGRHVFYGHDTKGAEIAVALIDRLRLTSYPKGHPLHIDKDKINWLIKNHLFALNTDVDKVSLNALKKRFFRDDDWGQHLTALAWSDSLASIQENGKPQLDKILALTKKIEEMKKQFGDVQNPPVLPLNGAEIMEILKIKPGQGVGLALEVVSEIQLENPSLTKDDAKAELEKVIEEIKNLDKAGIAKKLGIKFSE